MDGTSAISTSTERVDGVSSIVGKVERAMFGDDGLSFGDVLDVVNPLHHVPIVSTVYELVTNDEIAAGPKLVGGRLFGGWIGVGASAIDVAVEQLSGKSVGEHVTAFLSPNQGDGTGAAPPEWVAKLRSTFGLHERSNEVVGHDAASSESLAKPSVVATTSSQGGPTTSRPVQAERNERAELRAELETHRRRLLAQRNASYLTQLPFDVGSDRSANDRVL